MKGMIACAKRTASSLLCVALALAAARCGAPVEPEIDGAFDVVADRATASDARVEDATMTEDASAPDDARPADSGVQEDAPDDVPSCAPRCEGRVCGDDGCGGVCGTCGGGATCTAMGACTLAGMMGGGQWSITAIEGDVSPRNPTGGEWDVGINMTVRLPDPKVCITIGSGREECSGFISNTIAPAWNYRFPTGIDTAQLTGGMLRARLLDDDTAFDDTICPLATVSVSMAQVTSGRFEFRCPSGGVTFRLSAG